MSRKKHLSKEKIFDYGEIIAEKQRIETLKGQWNQKLFQNRNPLFLELGCGKGTFLNTLAERHPENNYLGIEIKEERLRLCAKTAREKNLKNVYFLLENILHLDTLFSHEEFSGIFMNFPDPWPKKRHEKRRLTAPSFLKKYREILKENGFLELKTDNSLLFHYSVFELLQEKWHIEKESLDLSQNKENIETEFEKRFRAQHLPIYFVRARVPIA